MEHCIRTLESIYLKHNVAPAPGFNQFIHHISTYEQKDATSFWLGQLQGAAQVHFPNLPDPEYLPTPNESLSRTISLMKRRETTVTSANILRASWAILLDWYLDTKDVTFGATLSGRSSKFWGIETLLGPTITTVPIRVKVCHEQTVAQFLEAIQQQAADMIPFEQTGLQNIGHLHPDLELATDFQNLLIVQTAASPSFLGRSLHVDMQGSYCTYALNAECTLSELGVQVKATYDPGVLSRQQMQHLLAQYEHIIHQLCGDGEKIIGDLDRLCQFDKDQIWKWNESTPPTIDSCAHELFRAKAASQPDCLAVFSHDGNLSYKDLDEASDRLANYLINAFNILPDEIVPLCVEKSKMVVVSMLAVWKAGAGFAPIDSAYPDKWSQSIFENVGARVVISSRRLDYLSPEVHNVVLNEQFLGNLPQNPAPISSAVSSRNICYVIHTSGSTGRPKGIIHEHQSYLSSALARLSSLFRGKSSRVLQFASYNFDVSIDDVLTTLFTGSTICIPSDHERKNDLVGYINRAQITNAELTPSLVRTLDPRAMPGLKVLSLSGESSAGLSKRDWIDSVTLLDEYGPAENSIKSHSRRIQHDTQPGNIGHSVTVRSWIVNISDHNKLQPIGSVGELLIEGPGLARGYVNLEETTRKSFIENPSWLPKELYGSRRLYKTGDLARYDPDGTIVILGRADNQVKIRGHRVEFGNIEEHIRKVLPRHATVVVDFITMKSSRSTGNLVAFIASISPTEFSSLGATIRLHLLKRLPVYMIPDALLHLDMMQTNISGKVNRPQLRKIGSGLEPGAFVFLSDLSKPLALSAPSTDMEVWMQNLWAEALGVPVSEIGANSHFIQIGGNSISAMKLVSLAKKAQPGFGLTVGDIFQYPILSDMAKSESWVKGIANGTSSSTIGRFALIRSPEPDSRAKFEQKIASAIGETLPIEDAYPCSPLQAGIMALSTKDPGLYIVQVVCILHASIDISRFKMACELVYDRAPILRTRIVQLQSILLQAVVRSKISWGSGHTLTEYLDTRNDGLMTINRPLTQWGIIEAPSENLFVWSLHHAIYDGWSMGLILTAIKDIYTHDVDWHPQKDFNLFIQYLEQMNHKSCSEFWISQLGNFEDSESTSFPKLPYDSYKPRAMSTITHRIQLHYTEPRNFTISTLVRAAWSLVVSRHIDSTDVIFGTVFTGRDILIPGTGDMVGPLFTTVPFRIKLEKSASVSSFLLDVQNQAMGMRDFQHFGLANIHETLGRDMSSSLFQTILVVQTEGDIFPKELFTEGKFNRSLSVALDNSLLFNIN